MVSNPADVPLYLLTHAVCVLQVDNKGNHLLVHEESSINVPAIAAAHVIKRYIAQASDELSFEVTTKAVFFSDYAAQAR